MSHVPLLLPQDGGCSLVIDLGDRGIRRHGGAKSVLWWSCGRCYQGAAPLLDVLDADQAVGDEAFQATLQPKVAAGLDLPSSSMCSKVPSAQLTRLI